MENDESDIMTDSEPEDEEQELAEDGLIKLPAEPEPTAD
jgi:hypothetical protein